MLRCHPLLPFVAASFGMMTFSAMDALMKGASLAVGAYNAMLWRSLAGIALALPLWLLAGNRRWPARSSLRLHAVRGANSAAMATAFFWGLMRMPIAEGIALSFIAPLMALYLAAVMLGEKIEGKAVIASLLGFGGVIVIGVARLGDGDFSEDAAWGIAAILFSAVLYAWNLILQRQQAQIAEPLEIALFQPMFVTLFLATGAPFLLVAPGLRASLDIAGGALLAMVSMMALSWAYARAEAQALLPVEYTAFIWAALFGWLMFGEEVTPATLLGVALIVIGCLIAARKSTEQTAL